MVALQALQNEQVAIVGLEVVMIDLKNVAGHIMDILVPQVSREEPRSLIDRLVLAPERVTELLRASSLTAAVETLVRVKSHYPEVNVTQVGDGPNQEVDLKAI